MARTIQRPFIVGIAGGSASGKSCLAGRLCRFLGRSARRLSLDDFYFDRSHLLPARRVRCNFDHPRAVDWAALEQVLREQASAQASEVPIYDFATHSRLAGMRTLVPGRILIVDGLWIFRRPSIRRWFDLRVFIECPAGVRLQRRLDRDVVQRGRSARSIREQFRQTVDPMHARYVEPQRRWAHLVLDGRRFSHTSVMRLVKRVRERS